MTIPGWAGVFIAELEEMFGPRDPSFTLVVIDVDADGVPSLWYPNSGVSSADSEGRGRHVIIRLGWAALTHSARARWQLAHECIHLLDPWNQLLDGGPTNWLKEGFATWYQNRCVPEAAYHEGLYAAAEDLVRPLTDSLPGILKRIRREQEMRIGEITPAVLGEYGLGASQYVLRRLCKPFSYD